MSDDQAAEIFEELRGINRRLDTLSALCPEHRKQTTEHDVVLHGPPENGTRPGVLGRLAKLEDRMALFVWGIVSAWGVLSAVLVNQIWAWLHN